MTTADFIVTDANGTPLDGAVVKITQFGNPQTATTDSSGHVSFPITSNVLVTPSNVDWWVTCTGYDSQSGTFYPAMPWANNSISVALLTQGTSPGPSIIGGFNHFLQGATTYIYISIPIILIAIVYLVYRSLAKTGKRLKKKVPLP